MTPEALRELCRSPQDWAALTAALAPLSEAQRAALAGLVTEMTGLDHSARPAPDLDPSSTALAALGVLTDLRRIAVYGFYFRRVALDAEPFLLQVLRDRRPRWSGRLVQEMLRDGWEAWRPAYLLVREGLVPEPTNVRFLTGCVFGLVGTERRSAGSRTVAHALREEPELLERVVWPMLAVATAGRRLRDHDLRDTWVAGDPTARPHEQTWTFALLDQVARGAMDRDRLLDTTLAAFLLDWPIADQAWFVHLHDALAPTLPEMQARRSTYLRLLDGNYGRAVALGQRCLGLLLHARRVSAEELLHASTGAVVRKEKALVLAQLRLLDELAGTDPARAADVARVVGSALQHSHTDVQERALTIVRRLAPAVLPGVVRDSAGLIKPTLRTRTPSTGAVRPPASTPTSLPDADAVVPVADVDELVELLLRTSTAPEAVQVERAYEALVRLGRRIPSRDLEALLPALWRAERGGGAPGVALIVQSLVRGAVARLPQRAVDRETWSDGGVARQPLWRLEHMVFRRAREIAAAALHGTPTLLALPSTTDGRVTLEDLQRRLEQMSDGVWPLDCGQAALRVAPHDYAEAHVLLESWGGEHAAAGVRRLAAYAPRWERVQWTKRWATDPDLPVWQDAQAEPGTPRDMVAAALDQHDMVGRFEHSQEFWGAAGDFGSFAVMWPLMLPHHPELLAAHAHARVVGPLLPGSRVDPKRSGAAPLLAGLGESRSTTGPVTCSALVYGLCAPSYADRTAATDALVELATHGLLDGRELGRQAAAALDDGAVTGSRLVGQLQEAAHALDRLSGPVLDALVEVLPSLPDRRDAHLFADLTAQLAVEHHRTVTLPTPLADLAVGRSTTALARAVRRMTAA